VAGADRSVADVWSALGGAVPTARPADALGAPA
jgi:hypothetical protein